MASPRPARSDGSSDVSGSLKSTSRRLIVRTLQELRLNKVAHKIYYRYVHGFNTSSPGLIPALDRCLAEAASRGTLQQGDYLEFGVFKGYAFWHAQQASGRHDAPNLRFFGFDSFAGIPDVEGIDRTDHNEYYKGQFGCSKQQVIANLDARGVDWNRTFLIEGYFDQSLTEAVKREHALEKASVVLVDCNLYASTVDVLNFVTPLIMENTILMMDDWNCFDADDSRGQRLAFREFLERNPQFRAEDWFSYGAYGRVFLMHLA